MTMNGASLLIVDDDEFNTRILNRFLERDGYHDVKVVGNGREALELVKSTPFDLVLLDIKMPEMDGIEVLQALKSDMRLREISVIMISANDEIETAAKCIEMGADDYVRKPFNPVFLRARVGACLEKKRLTDQRNSFLNQIKIEKNRADELLNVILPVDAANELRSFGKVTPRRYENVAVLFCDIVGFTKYCDEHSPEVVVSHFQTLVESFENITDKHEMEKIKTIGDEFMTTAGLLRANLTPLLSAVGCGLEMIVAAREQEPNWEVRVGVNCGPVVAGIVGRQRYQFDVWGDTVNTAAHMTSHGNSGAVTMSHDIWVQVQDDCEGRMLGHIEIKGKGGVNAVECYGLREG